MTSEEIMAARLLGMDDYFARLRSGRAAQGRPEHLSDRLLVERLAADYAAWQRHQDRPNADGRAA